MKEEHVQFEEWEPGEPLDEKHLAGCSSCRDKLERLQFIREAAETAPAVEVPPFFASRVSRLAVAGGRSFWDMLDRMARRMAPVFASLVLVASSLLYLQEQERFWPGHAELIWLAEEPSTETPESLDEMVFLLAQAAQEEGEENGNEEQH